jgi:hypothetical protein
MKNVSFIEELKTQSTWKLFFFGVITLGVYFAYYTQNISRKLDAVIGDANAIVSDDNKIPTGLTNTIFTAAWVNVLLILISYSLDADNPIVLFTNTFGIFAQIVYIVWAFKARRIIQEYCDLHQNSYMWFSGFGLVVAPPLYFNYKINAMVENIKHPNFSESN